LTVALNTIIPATQNETGDLNGFYFFFFMQLCIEFTIYTYDHDHDSLFYSF
jgi:hypothetical protein